MKINKYICVAMLFSVCAHLSLAQERTYENIALDYLKERLNKQSNGLKSSETKYYELPNKNMIVLMHINWSDGYIEDVYDLPPGAHGNFLTPQGWVHTKDVVIRTELVGDNRYAVFVSHTGEPLNYFVLPEKYDILPIKQGYICFLFDKSVQNVGGKSTPFYNNVICRDYEGNRLWGFPNDLIAFDIINTENNVYIAGEIIKDDGAYSLVRTVEIKTGKTKDLVGKKGDIALGVMSIDEGIQVTEYGENGSFRNYVLPYEKNDKDFQFNLIMNAYDQSKASDQVAIGERYLFGKGLGKDEKKAFEWFQKAANQSDSEGLYKLGYCYQEGYGVPKDDAKALSLYEQSANKGNTDAMIAVSDMYAEGVGVSKDESKALYWKEILGFGGNIDAQKYVISHSSTDFTHANNNAVEILYAARNNYQSSNYSWANYCYERAVSLGNKDAMFEYGKWLYYGNGITKDCNKAIEYLSKLGEEDNNSEAQKMLAEIYHENKGVSPDIKKEMYWITKAAENGDVNSQLKLGNAYRNGIGVKKNNKLAFAMYEKAALQGNPVGIYNMVYCYSTGEGVKKDKYSAILWFKKMDYITQLKTADSFYNGDGLKKNLELAAMMYKELSDNGNIQATKKLAMCYLDGVGVDKSIYTAHELIKKLDYSNDGNMYYIEAQYYEKLNKNTFKPSGNVVEMYRRAIKYGCKRAVADFIRYQKKYGLKLDINGSSY